jgi:nucleoside-diphosphate-sugar epimerase
MGTFLRECQHMRALVTGGTGFIGSRVVDLLLKQGQVVRLFSRQRELPRRLGGKRVTLYRGDLRDPSSLLDAMEGMDVVYHIGEIRNTSRHESERNVRALEWVVDELSQAGIERIVFVSSIGVAGIPSQVPATEETEPAVELDDHYTWYKRTCEKILADQSSAASVVIRPGMVYGPGSRYLKSLVASVQRLGPIGFPFISNGMHVAPFVHVNDVAEAICLAGTRPNAVCQAFNITDGLRHSWFDFFKAIADASQIRFRILPFPPLLMRGPAQCLDLFFGLFGVKLSLNNYVRYLTSDILFDPARARELLGWKPQKNFYRSVEEMVRQQ